MKNLLQLKTMLLLCALIVGSLSVWAEDEKITFSEQNYSNSDAIEVVSGNDFEIRFAKGTNSNNVPKYYTTGTAIRVYGGNTMTISSDTKTIAKIELTFGSSDGTNTITTDVGTYKDGTWTGESSSIKFTIGGTSGNRRLAAVAVTYKADSSDPSIAADNVDITYDAISGSINYTINNPASGGFLTASVTEGDWLTLGTVGTTVPFTCEANNTGAARTATVTLTYTYNTSENVSKTVTITQAGNPNAIMTIAEVRAQGTGSVVTKGIVTSCVGTTGYIQDATAAICVYGTALTVGDEIKVSGSLSAYKGLLEITSPQVDVLSQNNTVNPEVMTIAEINASTNQGWLVKIENATVTAIDNQNTTIAQGENTIIVRGISGVEFNVNDVFTELTGNIGCYSTAQIANPTNVVVQAASAVASITVDPVTIDVDAAEHDGTLALTYNNLPITGMDDFDIQYYDAEGGEINEPDWIEVLVAEQDPQIGEGYVVSYVIEENDGEARTAYLKVYALDDKTNVVYSDLITISQEAYVAPEVTIGNFVKVTSTDDITSGQYLIVYEYGGVAFDGSLETLDAVSNTIDVTINNGMIAATATNAKSVFNIDVTTGTLQSASGKYIGVTSNSNGMKTSNDATTYTHTFSIDEGENVVIAANFEGSTMTLRYNSATNQARFRYYKSGQQAVQLYKFVADAADATVNVTAAGYATYCSTSDLDFSNTAIKAYKATISGTEVSFKEVKQVPAGEGVLLKADEGTYSVPVAAYAAANTDNAFVGVTKNTEAAAGVYVLLKGEKGIGFYKTENAFTIGANTAYLPATAGTRNFIAIDEATAIEGIVAEKMGNGEIYNLQGQRVTKAQRGLYIMNGKKVMVK